MPHREAGPVDFLFISPRNVRDVAVLDANCVESLRRRPRERRGRGLVEEDVQEPIFFGCKSPHLTVRLVSLVGARLLAGPLAGSSRPRTGGKPQPQTCSLAAFRPPRSPGMRPRERPAPRAVFSRAHCAVPARSFLLEIRQAADKRGNPVPLGPDRAMALRSCTTRRDSLRPIDDSSGIVRWGASQVALARRARQRLIVPNESRSRKRRRHRPARIDGS